MLVSAFKHADITVKEVLDLGCGTGGICALLADRGYDMVALDLSPDMLNIARERNYGKNTLLLCQDMREFELYGTVQAVYSSFDCLN
jgi:SAM-dependent methyltransferase